MSLWKHPANGSCLRTPLFLYSGARLRLSVFGLFAATEAVVVLLFVSYFFYLKNIHPAESAFFGFMFMALITIASAKVIGIIRHWKRLPGQRLQLISRVGFYFQGGLVGGITAGFLAAKAMGVDAFVLFDGMAWGLLLGQSIGRLGCLNNGCCYGKPTVATWGIVYYDYQTRVLREHPELHGIRIHPTQIYASLMDMAGFITLSLWLASPVVSGIIASTTLTFLGFSRLFLERFRYDIYAGDKRNWTTATLAGLFALIGGILLTDRLAQQALSPISHTLSIESFSASVAANTSWLAPLCASTFIAVFIVYGTRITPAGRKR